MWDSNYIIRRKPRVSLNCLWYCYILSPYLKPIKDVDLFCVKGYSLLIIYCTLKCFKIEGVVVITIIGICIPISSNKTVKLYKVLIQYPFNTPLKII